MTERDRTENAVLLVHGFPLDRTLWDEQVDLPGARLLRLDLPGFGGSPLRTPRPVLGDSEATMTFYAEAVREELDRAGLERATLCGLSMGGYVLFEFYRRYPARVASLILCDTRAEADSAEGRQARLDAIALIRQGRRQEYLEGFIPKLLGPAALQSPSLVDHVRTMAARATDDGLIAALQAMLDRPDSTSTLGAIQVPTLIVVGADDKLTPPVVAQAMHQRIHGSQLTEIPQAGHLTPLEGAAAFNAALQRFLHLGSGS